MGEQATKKIDGQEHYTHCLWSPLWRCVSLLRIICIAGEEEEEADDEEESGNSTPAVTACLHIIFHMPRYGSCCIIWLQPFPIVRLDLD